MLSIIRGSVVIFKCAFLLLNLLIYIPNCIAVKYCNLCLFTHLLKRKKIAAAQTAAIVFPSIAYSESKFVMLSKLMPKVDRLCSIAEVAG